MDEGSRSAAGSRQVTGMDFRVKPLGGGEPVTVGRDEVSLALGFPGAGSTSAPVLRTGFLSVDLVTGSAGLPHGGVVEITGSYESTAQFVAGTVSEVSASGGRSVLLETTGGLGVDDLGSAGLDLGSVPHVEVNDVQHALDVLRVLLQDSAADLIVLNLPSAARSLSGRIGEFMRRRNQLRKLMNSTSSTVLVCRELESPKLNPRRLRNPELAIRLIDHGEHEASAELVWPGGLMTGLPIRWARRDPIARNADLVELATRVDAFDDTDADPEGFTFAGIELGSTIEEAAATLLAQPEMGLELEQAVAEALDPETSEDLDTGDAPAPIEEAKGAVMPTQQQPDGRRRFVNTLFEGNDLDGNLLIGGQYEFVLWIGHRGASSTVDSVPFEEPDFGGRDGIELLITLYGTNIDIATTNHKLWLPRTGESQQIRTPVIPRLPGDAVIRISISLPRELEVLQRVVVTVPIVVPTVSRHS